MSDRYKRTSQGLINFIVDHYSYKTNPLGLTSIEYASKLRRGPEWNLLLSNWVQNGHVELPLKS